jgi:hypothetical protein
MLAEIIWNEKTLAVVLALGIPIVGIIAGTWYKIESVKSLTNLKRKMIERGMSADEIERVIKAGPPEEE